MIEHVTKRTRPDLDWKEKPKGFYVADELVQSDAYRTLTKQESDLLLFILTRRKFPYGRKKKPLIIDYWNPLNGHDFTIPLVAEHDFFRPPGRMKMDGPSDSTIARSIKKLMDVGFLSLVELGGSGKGHMIRYRLENNWRVWRKGDGPCFKKQGLSRAKGFCQPGSGVFNPTQNALRN